MVLQVFLEYLWGDAQLHIPALALTIRIGKPQYAGGVIEHATHCGDIESQSFGNRLRAQIRTFVRGFLAASRSSCARLLHAFLFQFSRFAIPASTFFYITSLFSDTYSQ